ncbi:histidinol dehydrogenase [Thermatribacter velox]|uniref:Histidinol dehydrogenase n=1 Tax=Thermatribacter velox TaxID=3039681 RepID=A0ABZ2YAT0_9BACT
MKSIPVILKPVFDQEEVLSDLALSRRETFRFFEQATERVRKIVEDVLEKGDAAVSHYTRQFDGCNVTDFLISQARLEESWESLSSSFKETLKVIVDRVRRFHRLQKTNSWWLSEQGSFMGEWMRPLQSCAVYVPGGRFAYPSSLIMGVVPAQEAGVKNIMVFTPPDREGNVSPEIMATCFYLGIDNLYRVGGAQAIAACAFGTESIPAVDKIVGPGNVYVTAAKKLLYGVVGIDALAGPSEVVIVAERGARADWIALDLLAQAEHDPLAKSILLSDSEELLVTVKKKVEREWASNPLERTVPIYLYQLENLDLAWKIVEAIAPEHLEVMVSRGFEVVDKVKSAGAIFIGPYAPVALGDYGYGPNHVLPTQGSSRFASPLSVRDFVVASSVVVPASDPNINFELFAELAAREGLYFHQKSLLARMNRDLQADIRREYQES